MAIGESRSEVQDSEDEPTTSSPVHVSDGAADKLCAGAPAPPQDAQGATQAPSRSYQAPAESVANAPSDRFDGLGAEQENAFIDVDAPRVDQTDMQPGKSISEERRDGEALNNQIADSVSITSSDPFAEADDMSLQQDRLDETGFQVTMEPVITNASATDQALITPRVSTQNESMHAEDQQENAPHGTTSDFSGRISNQPRRETRHTADVEQEPPVSGRVAIDSFISDDGRAQRKNQLTESSAVRNGMSKLFPSQTDTKSTPGSTSQMEERAVTKILSDATHEVALQAPKIPTTKASVEDHEMTQDIGHAASFTGNSISGPQTKHDAVDVKMSGVGQIQVEDNCSPRQTPPSLLDDALTPVDGRSSRSTKGVCPPANNQVTIESSVLGSELKSHYNTSTSVSATNGADHMNQQDSGQANSKTSETHAGPNSPTPNAIAVDAQPETRAHDAATPIESQGPTTAMTPQEITLAELKAQKAALLASLPTLPAIQVLMEEKASSNAETSDDDEEPTEADIMAAANKIVKDHIKLLHEYNELKDVGQGLMGLIADQRGIRIIEVQEEFGVDAKD